MTKNEYKQLNTKNKIDLLPTDRRYKIDSFFTYQIVILNVYVKIYVFTVTVPSLSCGRERNSRQSAGLVTRV